MRGGDEVRGHMQANEGGDSQQQVIDENPISSKRQRSPCLRESLNSTGKPSVPRSWWRMLCATAWRRSPT